MRFFNLLLFFFISAIAFGQTHTLYIGTYTGTGSKGIYVYRFNGETGDLKWEANTDSGTVANPSYLALAPGGNYLYAVNETGGEQPGTVSSFIIGDGNRLQFLNKVPTGGDHPCYVAVHNSGKWVVAGNYSGGNLSTFAVNGDGSLQPPAQLVQHQGTGPNKGRQEKAHVHMTLFSPDGQQLFVPDLGTDKLHLYQFNPAATSPIQPAVQPFVKTTGGSGPRHLTFHPNGRYAYLMEELSGTVSAYTYNGGKLQLLQRISSHPKGFKGSTGSADIHVSPDGKFLYASNRGDANSIALFSIAPTGKPTFIETVSSGGKSPRNFTIAPGGRFLLVANQDTDNIVVFRRDEATGKLTPTGTEVSIPKPVCLLFDANQ